MSKSLHEWCPPFPQDSRKIFSTMASPPPQSSGGALGTATVGRDIATDPGKVKSKYS